MTYKPPKQFKCQEKGCDNTFIDAPLWFHELRKHFYICSACRPAVMERYREKLRNGK